MMLFKLSFKNIKKSMKDYAIYFFTLILGVAIFYVFNSIESQTVMLKVSQATYEIIKLMNQMLAGVSVFISFILGFLIIYASRFLIKRRNKEFGIYLTLGMSKRKISLILFFETLLIGIISLFIGLGIGVILSQFMSILVANMFEADMTNFKFIFSSSAFIKTLIYFGIMYLLVMIFNTVNISKCKLIDLINAGKKTEKIKLKNQILCTIIFIISSICLGYSYYLVTGGIDKIMGDDEKAILIPIILGCISTFFIFWSLSGLLLKIFMSFKNKYYKKLNCFTLRQVSSNINTTVFSMTIICLMLFVTICVLSSSLSLKNSLSNNLKDLTPMDVEFSKEVNVDKNNNVYGYTDEQINDSNISIKQTLNKLGFNSNKYLNDSNKFYFYHDNNLTLKTFLGKDSKNVLKNYPYLRIDSKEDIMRLSDYNKLAEYYGFSKYTLKKNEYLVIADYDEFIKIRNISLKKKNSIEINSKILKPKYSKCQYGFVMMAGNHVNMGIIIVPDSIVTNNMKNKEWLIANYKTSNKIDKEKINNILHKIDNNEYMNNTMLSANTKIDIYEASVGLGALVTFIGLYLGIIFLISSAAILALKELSESTDNKKRFMMLRRLGADEKMINKALFNQIFIFFMFPLLIAIIHSIFGIMFCNFILNSIGVTKLLGAIITTAIFIVFIYGGYFIITYICSKNIIKER